jgi:enamine deaminase RidA (YjgF/YER057c/UK114 family)
MSIQRIGVGARMSDATIHNGVLYTVEVPTIEGGDLRTQTENILAVLEQALLQYGTDKSKLLSVTVYLTNVANVAEFNAVWDQWLPQGKTPVRACVQAQLVNPQWLVEIQVICAM